MKVALVKPALIRWARERARLDATYLERSFPKYRLWETGEESPTLKQLEALARKTHAPLGFFFLNDPPFEEVPIPDFRTVGNEHVGHPSPDLLDTIYACQQRQSWYVDFAHIAGDEPLPFVRSARSTDDVVETAERIRNVLGFDIDERRRLPTWTDALRRFIEQADTSGILVMCSGVVANNTRRRLDPDEFRGFVLADPLAPLIFINGADTKAAQMFTLAHELAHVWLGQSAISDADAATVPEHDVERWCNLVAAEVLVPLDALRDALVDSADLAGEVARLARRFKVSTLVILRRLHDVGRLSRSAMWEAYHVELESLRGLAKGSGGNFYLTLGARVSQRFARALVVSTLEGRTSFTEAFRMLGIKKMATFKDVGRRLGVGV